MWQIVLTLVFYLWLFSTAYLLFRHAIGAGAQARKTTLLLADSNMKLAESNAKSAQAAHDAAQAALKLAELLEQRHAS
jgi:hypothetical protein